MPVTHPGTIAIDVIVDPAIPQQTRTYAEYRVFAVLTKYNVRPRYVRLTLRTIEPQDSCKFCESDAALEFDGREVMNVAVRGAHPYAAINRLIDRIDVAVSEYREHGLRAAADS